MTRILKSRGLLSAAIAALAFAAFLPALRNGFVDYDDPYYVAANGIVQRGLTWRGIRWALTTSYFANWHPLAWLSHMLDCQIFGVAPWGHHLDSLLLHAGVAALVFLFLDEATSDRVRSAAVALLFAVHPLRVESVAWVSERKDLLCALFFLLACRAHLRRARGGRSGSWVALYAALALMAKPMAVTLPLALLVLDFWPLRRAERPRALVMEKLPLFALAAAGAVIAMLAQVEGGNIARLPLGERLANGAVNLMRYLWLTFWPQELIPLYYLGTPARWQIWAAFAAAAALTAGAALLWRSRPAVTAGWAWFVVTLLPVLGIVQAGAQSVADRYMYLPHVGLFMALAWLLPDVAPRWQSARAAALGGMAALLALLSWQQTRWWKDSETLFSRILEFSPANPVANLGIGFVRLREHRLPEAEQYLRESLRVTPSAPAYLDLGKVLIEEGRSEEALVMFHRAWQLSPEDVELPFLYGGALMSAHKVEDAIAQYRIVQSIDPDYPGLALALGTALDVGGHGAEAIPLLQRAVREAPSDPAAHAVLGTALARRGRFVEAVAAFERTVQLKPDYPGAQQALKFAREDASGAQH